MDLGPIGLRVAAITLLGVDRSKECRSSAIARNSQLNPALASGFNVNRTAKERTLIGSEDATPSRVRSSRNNLEHRVRSNRNAGRDHRGFRERFLSESEIMVGTEAASLSISLQF
jgi:hypothetical protein